MSPMNIYSEPGTKVRYAYPKHGTRHDQAQCAALLKKDKVYTVKSCRAYDAHTSVVLEEIPDQTFNSVMFADEPNERAWTGADDITELGGLSADERDQLATDLRREQELAHEREHRTDGTPCWCEPTTIDPEIELGLEPDGGIDGTTGLPLGVGAPIVNAGGSGSDPRLPGLLQPLNDQVFLVRVQPPDRTASGLAIPESAQSKGCECRVLCAGPGAKHARTGERIPMSVAAGDRVVIGKWQGNEVTVPDHVRVAWGIDDREPVVVVRETDILAVVSIQE